MFSKIERSNFKKVKDELSRLDKAYISYSKEGKEFPTKLRQKRNDLLIQLANRFPDDERWLLPTSFGNAIRAFEVYPRIMYGIDSIPAWSRILALIPDKYLGFIEETKAKVDLWINILTLDILLLYGCLGLPWVINGDKIRNLLLFIVLEIIVGILAYFKAQSAAMEWGNFVKASFDLFLPDLLEKLGLDKPEINADEEKEIWHKLSQAYIYANPESLPRRNESRNSNQD